MDVQSTPIDGVIRIQPLTSRDHRGGYIDVFNRDRYAEILPHYEFVQDSLLFSETNVLRGLHYQPGQGKLVQVIRGTIFDVAVDMRRNATTFGRWFGELLDEKRCNQLFVPPHCAHGFCVVEGPATVLIKFTDNFGQPATIRWDDPTIGITWPVGPPILSSKDTGGVWLSDFVAVIGPDE